jgi:hypothetical protein
MVWTQVRSTKHMPRVETPARRENTRAALVLLVVELGDPLLDLLGLDVDDVLYAFVEDGVLEDQVRAVEAAGDLVDGFGGCALERPAWAEFGAHTRGAPGIELAVNFG